MNNSVNSSFDNSNLVSNSSNGFLQDSDLLDHNDSLLLFFDNLQ